MPRKEISVYKVILEKINGIEYPTKLGYYRYGKTQFIDSKLKTKPKKIKEINGGKPIPPSIMKIPCERAIRWRKHLLRIGKKADLNKEMKIVDEKIYLSSAISASPILTRNGVPVAKKVYKKRISLEQEQEQINTKITGVIHV